MSSLTRSRSSSLLVAAVLLTTIATGVPAAANAAAAPGTPPMAGTISAPAVVRKVAATKVSLTLSKRSVALRKPLYATGQVSSAGAGIKVSIGYKLPGGPLYTSTARTTARGRYRLRVPTWWAGTHAVLVTAAASTTTRSATSAAVSYATARGFKPAGSAKAYVLLANHGFMFNPCQVITYRVNMAHAPAGTLSDVAVAFSKISAASGLRFRYVGTSSYIPFAKKGHGGTRPKSTDLVVAWSNPSVVPDLAGSVVGVGGPEADTGTWQVDGLGTRVVARHTGGASLDYTANLKKGYGAVGEQSLLMHELGHAIGLDHSHATNQIMYPTIRVKQRNYGAGDIAGLSKLGLNNGCFH